MNDLNELVLLGAIGLPIALVAAAKTYLALTGERGTLLIPGPSAFGPFEEDAAPDSAPSAGS
jgi:hypothetical protein